MCSPPPHHPLYADDFQQLWVNIPHPGPLLSSLGSSISIPCSVVLPSSPAASLSSPGEPRIKWSVISGGIETQILVAKGDRIKINEAYRNRTVRLNYTSSSYDTALWLGDLRSSDSGYYRCEVLNGLEDSSDVLELKVKGKMKKKNKKKTQTFNAGFVVQHTYSCCNSLREINLDIYWIFSSLSNKYQGSNMIMDRLRCCNK